MHAPVIGMPQAQGLYDPAHEHDACGVGFIAHIDGAASHDIIRSGIDILRRLTHRGAVSADPLDGDGAGITIQIPDTFYREIIEFTLPPIGDYATGLVFLPREAAAREACQRALKAGIESTGCHLLGWRQVPTDNSGIGSQARATEPLVRQVFVGRGTVTAERFPLMLYLGRRRAENQVLREGLAGNEYFYINSLSARTVLYKGMLLSEQIDTYFPELADERVVSAVALVHQRYSTNTFPTCDLAQPFRLLCHNSEINTLRCNINRMRARQAIFAHQDLGPAVADLAPVIVNEAGSDTACLDNAVELLVACGYKLEQALAMMIPEAYITRDDMPALLSNFYRYFACLMEPWDGPANIAACDGRSVVACLDRNGLRPARYWVTTERTVVYASEAGVLDIPPEQIIAKGRLGPGMMLMVDMERGVLLDDAAIKDRLGKQKDYGSYLRQYLAHWQDLPPAPNQPIRGEAELIQRQRCFGYTSEDIKFVLASMCTAGAESIHSMGTDTPLAVLSQRPKLLPWYFKQAFAQVTNPAIDPIREELVMSLRMYLGTARNILQPGPDACRMLEIDHPILTNQEISTLIQADTPAIRGARLDITYPAEGGSEALVAQLEALAKEAATLVDGGCNVLVLCDRAISAERIPIPAVLALSALHQHLIRSGRRTQCSLVVSSGEPREVHHFALLFAYGAAAVNPYLAFDSIQKMATDGTLAGLVGNDDHDRGEDSVRQHQARFIQAVEKGLKKILSKMGIPTLQSYAAAQIFEAVGIDSAVVERYFTGTRSVIGGVGLAEIEAETRQRHQAAFIPRPDPYEDLEQAGEYQWRREGEQHLLNPEVIALLQQAVRSNDAERYRRFAALVNDGHRQQATLRALFSLRSQTPISLDEVESAEAIMRRFCTGAMSLGSISPEAHETLAKAMNAIGGKSNTGEGGEDPARFSDDRCSAIKQVASGRFGVTPHYLVNAREIQIKICQGAKPGEGGHLPGHKVSEYIAWLRHSVPQVTLISPPPHHDIYSIEDLAQLIYDLKNVNPQADISVKLVSLSGVGTVAAGVAKGHADTIIIAGYDGGTGASPASSIKHAGIPWEIGLAETHQTLLLNDLRGRVRLQTDGKLATGRDLVIAACLGAEEYGFATLPLITIGCIMMRKCHLGTCPVGIATQMQGLREKFRGRPEDVINYFRFVAEEAREIMASLGVRTLDELVGRTDLLDTDAALRHWKSRGLDYSRLLSIPTVAEGVARYKTSQQDHGIEEVLDRSLIAKALPVLDGSKRSLRIRMPIFNYNRTTGAMLSGEIARRHGRDGLKDGALDITFTGVAGQSFGCFLAPGIRLTLIGEGNDYCGKGMHGGRLVVRPDPQSPFVWSEHSVVGNTVLYGATGGRAFFAGRAGERFCVRNSGAVAVVEGVGDHGCEYMTGGRVLCLGPTGRNFAAGMSGGIAYVLDEDRQFGRRCNQGMVDLEVLDEAEDIALVHELLQEHHQVTESAKARRLLDAWPEVIPRFVKVFPHEYRRALAERKKGEDKQAQQRQQDARSTPREEVFNG